MGMWLIFHNYHLFATIAIDDFRHLAELEKFIAREQAVSVPQTDAGRWVEKTKVIGRTLSKELGKKAFVT